jgi:hypothetical protein
MAFMTVAILAIAGCAGPNPSVHVPDASGQIAGFWLGLWQGLISPITFIISLFSDNVHVYEVHNNGGWYNFGFLWGVGIAGVGGGSASSRR